MTEYFHGIRYEDGGGVVIYRSSHDEEEFHAILAEYSEYFNECAGGDLTFIEWCDEAGYNVEEIKTVWHDRY